MEKEDWKDLGCITLGVSIILGPLLIVLFFALP